MKKKITFLIICLTAFLLVSCGGGGVIYDTEGGSGRDGSWTVLVYMMGGANETQNGTSSEKLEDMMSVNYPDSVHVAVQTGGSGVWHQKGVYSDYIQRFEVGKNALYLKDQKASGDMGNYGTLADFVTWGIGAYNTDNYMLIISGSGGGSMYGIGSDELYGNDCLTLEEIGYAMSLAGRSLELVGMDASLMGSLETALALSTCADYLVAPQDMIGTDGWDYAGFLNYLCENPSADGAEIGRAVCDSCYKKAITLGNEKYTAMSVTDLSKISTLNQAFDGMAGDMLLATNSLGDYKNLSSALSSAHVYGGATEDEGFSDLIDLGDAAVKMRGYIGTTSDMLLETLSDTVVYNVRGDEQSASSGLGFYYPLDMNNDRLQTYMDMSLSGKYKEFLKKVCVSCAVTDDSNTPDYTSSGAWSTYNEDMSWLEYQTVLDGNSYELYISGNMDLFRDAAINVYKLDKESEKYIFAGRHHSIESDWEGGIFRDNFSGVLPELSGKAVSMRLVRSYADYDLYSFPAAVNGNVCHVRVKHYPSEGKYEIAGIWNGLDGMGLARGAMNADMPDKITPLLSVYDSERVRSEYTLGSPQKLRGVSESKIEDGRYIFEYELTDVYGQKRYGTPVNANVSGRKITYEQR